MPSLNEDCSSRRPRDAHGTFRPLNTLGSPKKPRYPLQPWSANVEILRPSPPRTHDEERGKMVRQREPPRLAGQSKMSQPTFYTNEEVNTGAPASQPGRDGTQQEPFPLRPPRLSNSSIQNDSHRYMTSAEQPPSSELKHVVPHRKPQAKAGNPFVVLKTGVPRPEHHRPSGYAQTQQSNPSADPGSAARANGFDSISNGRSMSVAANPATSTTSSIYDVMADYTSAPTQKTSPSQDGFRMPSWPLGGQALDTGGRPGATAIIQPSNPAPRAIPAAPRPMYSSNTNGFQPANAWKAPPQPQRNVIDLTQASSEDRRDSDDLFDPNKALSVDGAFGSYDPNNYVDAAQASENIKALLEGAFEEDEEDKPKTQLRRRVKKDAEDESAADVLTGKLKGLDVKDKQEEQKSREAEEEEVDDGSVEGLDVKLLPHQIDGVAWMLDKEIGKRKKNGVLPKGGILADDMGLGKTIQALSLVLSNPRPTNEWVEQNPKQQFPKSAGKGTLVVAPLALIKQWEAEIKDKVSTDHKLKVLVHHGPSRTKRFDDLKKYDVVISTYQTLTSEFAGTSPEATGIKVGCFGVHWYRVILDEAHSIKNRNAKMTQAAYHLRGVYRWCLTGTPIQNNLEELQSLIRFLQIKPYCDLKHWKDQIGIPMKNGRGGLAMKRLQFFLKAFMKRRTKDILKKDGALRFGKASTKPEGGKSDNEEKEEGPGFKIVGRTIESVIVDFSGSERDFYDKLAARTEKSLAEMMSGEKSDYVGALVLLLRLRQICNHPDLIRTNLSKEKDTIEGGNSQRPPPTKNVNKSLASIDGLEGMFGALSMATKDCDVCKTKLGKTEADAGATRCQACETDIAEHQAKVSEMACKKKHKHGHKTQNVKHEKGHHSGEKQKQRAKACQVVDSDDDDEGHNDEEGEWIVEKDQQKVPDLGKAGGQEDEDAEGGGEWLNSDSEDSDAECELLASEKALSTARTTMSSSCSVPDDNDDDDSTSDLESSDSPPSSEPIHTGKPRKIPSTKIKHLIEILARESPTHKIIVFSEFTSMLDIIEPLLDSAQPSLPGYTRYDGSMAHPAREASLHALRNDPSVRILLCSLKCGSLGLNLTCASRVVLLEPFWNPFVEEQAIDRVHRLNQTEDVVVYKLTVRDSVEERILALQAKKRELAAQAIEGGGAAAGQTGVNKLSMKDILSLFKRDADMTHERDGITDRRERVLPVGGPAMGLNGKRVVSAERKHHPTTQGQFGNAYGRRW